MDQKLKILLLEDLPTDAELVKRALVRGNITANILVVNNKTSFIKALIEFSPDIILSDHSLPSLDSIEAMKIVKDLLLDIPFILVTATMSEEFAVEMLNRGADDYILKSNLTRLPSSVDHVLNRHSAHKERVKAKKELAEAHERLMFHLESSPLGYIEWDNMMMLKSMSKRAEEIFGYTEVEFKELNKNGSTLIHEEDVPDSYKTALELINGTLKSSVGEYRSYTKNGKIIWCEWFNSALKNKNGDVIAIMSLVQDITERKKLERDTLNLVENLQLKNKDLKQFSYMVSHDLRAPIAKILGLSMLFKHKSKEPEYCNDLFDNITKEALNLDNVVKDMNTVVTARDSGNLEKEYIRFKTYVDLISKVLEKEITDSGAIIITDFSDAEGVVTVKGYLYSIIFNLISNAIKYRRTETLLNIHIKSTMCDDNICLEIKDNGSGIDLNTHGEKLFGLYKRFHGDDIPGRGIGLSLVKTQTESMGGRVEVESTVNIGTTFKISLPK